MSKAGEYGQMIIQRTRYLDRLAKLGNPERFHFAMPNIPGLDYSFSGVKTSLLYRVRDEMERDPQFLENNKDKCCVCVYGHFIYVDGQDYYSFFENEQDPVVCVWYIRQ